MSSTAIIIVGLIVGAIWCKIMQVWIKNEHSGTFHNWTDDDFKKLEEHYRGKE